MHSGIYMTLVIIVIVVVGADYGLCQDTVTSERPPENGEEKGKEKGKKEKKEEEKRIPRVELGDLVVTAPRIPTKLKEVQGNLTIVTDEKIQQTNAIELSDALSLEEGIFAQDSGSVGADERIVIRGIDGYQGKYVLTLVDGHRLNTLARGCGLDWARVPTNIIERVEVLRGPYSALYGTNAFTGVINIVTKEGEKRIRNELITTTGSNNTYIYQAASCTNRENWGYLIALERKESDNLTGLHYTDSKGREKAFENRSYKGETCWARIGYKPSKKSSISFTFSFYDKQKFWKDTKLTKGDYALFALDYRLRLSDRSRLKFFYQRNDDYDVTLSKGERDYGRDVTEDSGGVQYEVKLDEANHLTLGAELIRDNYDYLDKDPDKEFSGDVETRAAYIQDSVNLLEGEIILAVGLRLDSHSAFGEELSPKLSCKYSPIPYLSLHAGVGRSFLAPAPDDLYKPTYEAWWYDPPRVYMSNPDLSPEYGWSYELGAKLDIVKRLSVAATGFYIDGKHFITTSYVSDDPDTGYEIYQKRNMAEVISSGVEMGIRYQFTDSLLWGLNFTYTDTRDPNSTPQHLDRHPYKIANSTLVYKLNRKLTASVAAHFVDSRFYKGERSEYLEEYVVVDVRLSYTFSENLDCFVGVKNLFDEEWRDWPDYPKPGRQFLVGGRLCF